MVAPVSQTPSLAAAAPISGGRPVSGLAGPAQAAGAKPVSFASTLEAALQSVSSAQVASTTLQRQYQAGVPGVSLEQTMVAMQKADIGFQSALAVRNRLVSAYSDIMNMQV